jgi:hypothetical protein
MDNVLLYPKTSCTECRKEYKIPPQRQSDVCDVSPYFDCYSKVEIKSQVFPWQNKQMYALNPQVYTDKLAEGFDKVACKTAPTCPEPSYISLDPRLYDSARATYLPLDRPPMSGQVRLKDIYNKKYTDYGIKENQYGKINDGQITYYIDESIAPAFFEPVWAEPAQATLNLYKDPMGAMKPEHNRQMLVNNINPTVQTPISYPYCLSYIQDSQTQREDLMAYQQRKHNQEKWSARW